MTPEQILVVEEVTNRVKKELLNETSGHDWFHIERVNKTAKELAEKEEANVFVVSLAALLHDLADDKVISDEAQGIKKINQWLVELKVPNDQIQEVIEIIQTISFKGGNIKKVATLEAEVVQDADRLDAIGAIGVARCFVYSGSIGQKIDDPSIPVRDQMSVKEYRKGPSTAINHFYEKLLRLKELMNTKAGKEEANVRHVFMEQFLEEFYRETRQ